MCPSTSGLARVLCQGIDPLFLVYTSHNHPRIRSTNYLPIHYLAAAIGLEEESYVRYYLMAWAEDSTLGITPQLMEAPPTKDQG